MKLRVLLITSCADPAKWYASLVGCIVPLYGVEETEYKSSQPEGFTNFISKIDAKIIDIDPRETALYDNYL